jgi:hypothetical protein
MSIKYLYKYVGYCIAGVIVVTILLHCCSTQTEKPKPRILISSDIGGTDPDDFQSMIHLFMYADLFQIEGLISSPFGSGRKEHILEIINHYEKDFPKLRKQSKEFPEPAYLREICKQGAIPSAPYKGFSNSTEGSEWIIKCAKRESNQPLWVLVWGGLEDLAQALHDAPEIKKHIRVYWIGGPNKKWSINAYSYIAENHPDLWMIEANATYRGWFMDEDSPENIKGEIYYKNFIQGKGAMGADFRKYYNGNIKMGDTPSLAYLMKGNHDDPTGESWGGSFVPVNHTSRYIYNRNTSLNDTVAVYSTLEWRFKGPEHDIPDDSACFILEINKQKWPGYYLGNGDYGVRYSSKQPEICTYVTTSPINELNNQIGQFVSIIPWPGKPSANDYKVGSNWYTDNPNPKLFIKEQQGAKTVSKYRKEFLLDWAKRWEWLK